MARADRDKGKDRAEMKPDKELGEKGGQGDKGVEAMEDKRGWKPQSLFPSSDY